MWTNQQKKQVREVQGEITTKPYRWQANGLLALQEVGLRLLCCRLYVVQRGVHCHIIIVVSLPIILGLPTKSS